MTKRILSILLLTAATVVSVWAGPVDRQRAEAAAVAHIKGVTGKSRTVKQVQAVDDAFYVVNLAPQGWVMVSADDKVDPVIGYSATGALAWPRRGGVAAYPSVGVGWQGLVTCIGICRRASYQGEVEPARAFQQILSRRG